MLINPKIGDKVRAKSNQEMLKEYGNHYGNEFNFDLNKVYIIKEVSVDCLVKLNGNGNNWDIKRFILVEKKPPKFYKYSDLLDKM